MGLGMIAALGTAAQGFTQGIRSGVDEQRRRTESDRSFGLAKSEDARRQGAFDLDQGVKTGTLGGEADAIYNSITQHNLGGTVPNVDHLMPGAQAPQAQPGLGQPTQAAPTASMQPGMAPGPTANGGMAPTQIPTGGTPQNGLGQPGSLTPEAHLEGISQNAKARYEATQLAFHNSVQGIDKNTIAGQAKILALGKGAQTDLAASGAEYKDASLKVNEMRLNRYGDAITRAFWNSKDPQAVVAQYGPLMQALGVNPTDYTNAKFDTMNPNGARDNKGELLNKEPGVTLGNGIWVPNYLYAMVASGKMTTTDLTKILHDEDMKKQDFDKAMVEKKYMGDNALAVAEVHAKHAADGVYAAHALNEQDRAKGADAWADSRVADRNDPEWKAERNQAYAESMLPQGKVLARNQSASKAGTRDEFHRAVEDLGKTMRAPMLEPHQVQSALTAFQTSAGRLYIQAGGDMDDIDKAWGIDKKTGALVKDNTAIQKIYAKLDGYAKSKVKGFGPPVAAPDSVPLPAWGQPSAAAAPTTSKKPWE